MGKSLHDLCPLMTYIFCLFASFTKKTKEEEKGKEEGRKERRERKGKREINPFLIQT